MATEDARTVIEEFVQAFNEGDVGAVMKLMTTDCVFENTNPPDGTRHQGHERVRGCWEEFFAGCPRAFFETEDIVAMRDRGMVRWTLYFDKEDPTAGHIRGVDILTLRDGLVSEKLTYVKG